MQPTNPNNNKRKAPPANTDRASTPVRGQASAPAHTDRASRSVIRRTQRQSVSDIHPFTRQDSGFSIASLGDESTTSSHHDDATIQVANRTKAQTTSANVTHQAEEKRQRLLSPEQTANEAKQRANQFAREYYRNLVQSALTGDITAQRQFSDMHAMIDNHKKTISSDTKATDEDMYEIQQRLPAQMLQENSDDDRKPAARKNPPKK